MKRPGSLRKGGRTALAGLASFFRQLSLFDPEPLPTSLPGEGASLAGTHPVPINGTPIGTALQEPFPLPGTRSKLPPPASIPPQEESRDIPSFAELCRGPYAHVRIASRPRLWESWRVAWTRRRESLRLEIPAALEEAPRPIKQALLEWTLLVTRRGGKRDPILRARRAELEAMIRAFLSAPGNPAFSRAAERRRARDRRKVQALKPQGRHHDLEAIFRQVNARYFDGRLEARLTWSARLGGLSTHSLAMDGDGRPYHLLSISRGYDDAEVTPEILGGVVYHECLHIAIPPRREGGRRVVHGPDFRRREREYEHFAVWRRWHREGLPKALRRLRRGPQG